MVDAQTVGIVVTAASVTVAAIYYIYNLRVSNRMSRITLTNSILQTHITPESLNGETGLICSYLGGANEFSGMKVYEILEGAKSAKGRTSGINFVSLDRLSVTPRQRIYT